MTIVLVNHPWGIYQGTGTLCNSVILAPQCAGKRVGYQNLHMPLFMEQHNLSCVLYTLCVNTVKYRLLQATRSPSIWRWPEKLDESSIFLCESSISLCREFNIFVRTSTFHWFPVTPTCSHLCTVSSRVSLLGTYSCGSGFSQLWRQFVVFTVIYLLSTGVVVLLSEEYLVESCRALWFRVPQANHSAH